MRHEKSIYNLHSAKLKTIGKYFDFMMSPTCFSSLRFIETMLFHTTSGLSLSFLTRSNPIVCAKVFSALFEFFLCTSNASWRWFFYFFISFSSCAFLQFKCYSTVVYLVENPFQQVLRVPTTDSDLFFPILLPLTSLFLFFVFIPIFFLFLSDFILYGNSEQFFSHSSRFSSVLSLAPFTSRSLRFMRLSFHAIFSSRFSFQTLPVFGTR